MHTKMSSANTLFYLILCSLFPVTSAFAGPFDQTPYAVDQAFADAGGGIKIEHFSDLATPPTNSDHSGEAAVAVPDGDVIVASLVPAWNANSNPSNGKFNLGLVRYNVDGIRQTWPNAAAGYTPTDDHFLTYPNSSIGEFEAIWDMKLNNSVLYILAYDGNDARLIRFGTNGASIGDDIVGSAAEYSSNPYLEYGGGLVFYRDGASGPLKMVVAMTSAFSTIGMFGFEIISDVLIDDNDFGGPDAFNSKYIQLLDKNICAATSGSDCQQLGVTDVVATYFDGGTENDGTIPTIYITGSYQSTVNSGDPLAIDVFLMAVHADTGELYTTFGPDTTAPDSDDGVIRIEGDSGSSNDMDLARGIAAYPGFCFGSPFPICFLDSVYVAFNDDAECGTTNIDKASYISVAAFNGAGSLNTAFNNDGIARWGAQCSGATTPENAESAQVWDMETTSDGLAIVGQKTTWNSSIGDHYARPHTAMISTGGNIMDLRIFGYITSNIDSNHPKGWFRSIAKDGDRSYYVTGTSDQIPSFNENSDILVARMQADRIFGSGFNSLSQ